MGSESLIHRPARVSWMGSRSRRKAQVTEHSISHYTTQTQTLIDPTCRHALGTGPYRLTTGTEDSRGGKLPIKRPATNKSGLKNLNLGLQQPNCVQPLKSLRRLLM